MARVGCNRIHPAMSEDSIIQYFGIQLTGGRTVCHDESVYQNNHLQFGGLQHGAYCHNISTRQNGG